MRKEVAVAVADLHHLVPLQDLHPQGQAHLDQGVHAAARQEDHLRQAVDL